MITITIPASDWYDEKAGEILQIKETTLSIEYSLISVSEYEAHTHKAFLSKKEKTLDEWLYFFYCMVINKNGIDPRIFYAIPAKEYVRLQNYIADPMTATTITNRKKNQRPTNEMTSEELYAAMSMLNIPYECKKWHLSRLITLIEVCAARNSPPEKMSKADAARGWRELNAKNRAKYKSKG
jgi:hypothetical protein